MDQLTKNTEHYGLPEGVPTERRINGIGPSGPYGDAANHVMNTISTEELRKRNESLIENIGALRFSIARIELLEEQKGKLRDTLSVIRTVMRSAKDAAWCRTIDTLLDETAQ